jgi:hypothetical protein
MVDRRTMEDGSFLADGLAGSAPSIVYGTGRVCIEPDCSVRLSRYNSTEWCALHESPASTHRPYDTSTRQPKGRRRNARSGRRRNPSQATNGSAAAARSEAAEPSAEAEQAESPAKATGTSSKSTSSKSRRSAA